ncbi:MAG: hypothetical protein H6531_06740 [Actinobacteria bacterium]|nr:hypothetical protein [Thermoleophilia bacterium]MCB9011512.1 hypothetical protein [Actinomycetota bacterium]
MTRLFDVPVGRAITLGGAVMFGVFFLGAVVGTAVAGQDGAFLVAGVLAYAFLAYVVVIVGAAWLRRPRGAQRVVADVLKAHPELGDHLGEPIRAEVPANALEGQGHTTLTVPLTGERGTGTLELSLVRLEREWEVLDAALIAGGTRVPLAGPRR